MRRKKKMKKDKKVIAIDLILVVGTLLMILLALGYYESSKLVLLSPGEVDETLVLFEFVGTGEVIVDENLDFDSPEVYFAEENPVIQLERGTYYFKLIGEGWNEIREVEVESEISLMLGATSEGYEVVNVGGERLDVDVYLNDEYEESVKVGISGGAG